MNCTIAKDDDDHHHGGVFVSTRGILIRFVNDTPSYFKKTFHVVQSTCILSVEDYDTRLMLCLGVCSAC